MSMPTELTADVLREYAREHAEAAASCRRTAARKQDEAEAALAAASIHDVNALRYAELARVASQEWPLP